MNKRELQPFIPPGVLISQGKTLDAIYMHFIDGLPVQEAAEKAGVARGTITRYVYPMSKALTKAGYRRRYMRRVVYFKA